jgi:hypothetical protein
MSKQTITIEGSGPNGRLIGSDLAQMLNDIDATAPVKARTTLGGWIKSLTYSRIISGGEDRAGGTGEVGPVGEAGK